MKLLAEVSEEPPGVDVSMTAIHPGIIVAEQQQVLGSLWSPSRPPSLDDLQHLGGAVGC